MKGEQLGWAERPGKRGLLSKTWHLYRSDGAGTGISLCERWDVPIPSTTFEAEARGARCPVCIDKQPAAGRCDVMIKAVVHIGRGSWSFAALMDLAAVPHEGDSISPNGELDAAVRHVVIGPEKVWITCPTNYQSHSQAAGAAGLWDSALRQAKCGEVFRWPEP